MTPTLDQYPQWAIDDAREDQTMNHPCTIHYPRYACIVQEPEGHFPVRLETDDPFQAAAWFNSKTAWTTERIAYVYDRMNHCRILEWTA